MPGVSVTMGVTVPAPDWPLPSWDLMVEPIQSSSGWETWFLAAVGAALAVPGTARTRARRETNSPASRANRVRAEPVSCTSESSPRDMRASRWGLGHDLGMVMTEMTVRGELRAWKGALEPPMVYAYEILDVLRKPPWVKKTFSR